MNSRHHRRLRLKQRRHVGLQNHHARGDPAAEHAVAHHPPPPARQHAGIETAELIQQAAPAAGGEKIHQRRAAESRGSPRPPERKFKLPGGVEPEVFDHPLPRPAAVFRTGALESRTGGGTRRQKFSIVR